MDFEGKSFMVGVSWPLISRQYWYIDDSTVLVTHDSTFGTGPLYVSVGMTSGGSCSGVMKVEYVRARILPPNNVMPLVDGQDVVSDLGCVNLTASGIQKENKGYLNISGYPAITENDTLYACIELLPGQYYYNVSTEYRGSKLSDSGTFNVELNSLTKIFVVFAPNYKHTSPTVSALILPPEIYLMVAYALFLMTGSFLILFKSKRRSN